MSKQTILGRVSQLAKTNVVALLDQADDPQKMTDQLIREYTRTIREAEDTFAATIGSLRLTEQDHAEDVAAAAEWGGKAGAASRKADMLRAAGSGPAADRLDNLARIALGRQLQSEQEAVGAEPTIAAHNELLDKLKAGLDMMNRKLGQLQSRRDELVAHSRTAAGQQRIADTVITVDILDPTSELDRFEDKVRREEAKAGSKQEPAASTLDGQFESLDPLSEPTEVDARLARLKSGAA